MKFIVVLGISLLLTVSVGTFVKNFPKNGKNELVSPLIAGASVSINSDTSQKQETNSIFGWQIFVNNYYGYKIKHPSDINIKNKRNGDINLIKDQSVNLTITQDVLTENDTINTVMEKVIDEKKNQLKDKFILVKNISPIAIGSVTAVTYSSVENGLSFSYYFIPQSDKKYLFVTNATKNTNSVDFLISEDIIYSIEIIP